MEIRFTDEMPKTGLVVVPLFQGAVEGPALEAVDAASNGAVMRAVKAAKFRGKSGETMTLPGPVGLDDAVIVLIGLGKAEDVEASLATGVGGKAFAQAKNNMASVSLLIDGLSVAGETGATLAVSAALGATLRAYEFGKYKKKTAATDRVAVEQFSIVGKGIAHAAEAYEAEAAVAEGVALARDLVSEPPNVLHPEHYADRCRELESLGVNVTIFDEAQMADLGMNLLLGVGQGSVRGSRMAVMEWKGGAEGEAPIALVGKGVTFDTGGISLKPPAGMEEMKFDMGGSAAVVGAMKALAGRKAKANVVGLVGLVENMPDGNAQRPADIVTSMSGQTVEILNTDAEGRLVLADVLTYAQKTYHPKTIIDLATLTGAIIIALAHDFAGLFSKTDSLSEALLAAAHKTGEELWRMPVGKMHDEMIKSDVADMKNVGGREAGSSSAAAFLGKFIENGVEWAHLDIAGTAWTKKDLDICPKGATGYGVRLLDRFVRETGEA
ncbi:leucyl aminopeptidase [Parvularcula bermudensis HTCC2503]|uniref:Probable cytosol aminopeptidase n=1 Tax=Parvularcula bermudensis (strain ATCC BAA-594 / HTCC2503 / KCTC 12087) TaxID=314260 RepID=E0TCR1_PARBH|nr:leucyl aminopeptidase [Parvularcula bermudensis]ADM09850.1 leucyl aminopeptidase [Parvularcula bermudensis HTCC2503]